MAKEKARKKGMVHVRGGFSDINGIAPYHTEMQYTEFDDKTRVKLSNLLYKALEFLFNNPVKFMRRSFSNEAIQLDFCRSLVNDVFCEPLRQSDYYQYTWKEVFTKIQEVILNAEYNEVLDVIKYTCNWVEDLIDTHKGFIYELYNDSFEDEYVGYRFVNGCIIPITEQIEIDAINEACNNPFDGSRKQIQKAVEILSDRTKKDYKNSIKESISAVESVCQIIVGNDKATLSDALRSLEKNGTAIHPSLKVALTKLYAYTSDQGGIRHAEGMFESNVTFEEAKFMLVSCSAFINYLIAEYGKGSK